MKENMRKKLKNTKGQRILSKSSGITLVALVVTIIVLLILAGVALGAVFSQDGIFTRTEQAKEKHEQGKARETLELALSEAQIQKYEEGLTDEQLDEKILKVGSLLPREKTNPNLQNVTVNGYIFEIDRSVPKISNYIGQEVEITKDIISVEDAKRMVTSVSELKKYIGTKVNYKAGETWQIFYYDDTGEFGPEGMLYLKRAYGEVSNKILTLSTKTNETDPAVAIMKKMNPKWANSEYSAIDLDKEKACVWLCDPTVWNSKKNDNYSSYAIGSPSVEMYVKAYNIWKTGDKNSGELICDIAKAGKYYGYAVGANGTYKNYGCFTDDNVIEAGPKNIFMVNGNYAFWLASPALDYNDCVLRVNAEGCGIGRQCYYVEECMIGVVAPLDIE